MNNTPAIRITARRDGHRRAGISHVGSRVYPAGHFSPEQLEALRNDPQLVVSDIGDDAAPLSVVAAVETLAAYHGLTFEQVVDAVDRAAQNPAGEPLPPAAGGGGDAGAAPSTPSDGLAQSAAEPAGDGAGSGERGDPAPAAPAPAQSPGPKGRRVTGGAKAGGQ